MKVDKNKYGLVLAGGGGKGGYEIGVWKALRESKMLNINDIGAVSGTSVGALNAALFAAGDYEVAEKLWRNISMDKVLTLDPMSSTQNILRALMNAKICNGVLRECISYIISRYCMFSRDGLKAIIENSGALEKIDESAIPCYATCLNVTHSNLWHAEFTRFCLNECQNDKKAKILIATSAIPGIFPQEEIEGDKYWDGGVIPGYDDNLPVVPMYEDLGLKKFVVVHLSRDGVESFSEKFPDAYFVHVMPKKDLGSALNFTPENAVKRINDGYNDMMRQIELLDGVDKSLSERNKTAEDIHTGSVKYYDTINPIISDSVEMMQGSNLLEDPAFRFDDSNMKFSELDTELCRNKKKMDKFILDAVTCLSVSESQIDELHRANWLRKIWNFVSGKSGRLRHGIDNNAKNVQQAIIETIREVVDANKITVDLLNTVRIQLQGADKRMAAALKVHGQEIRSIKDDYSQLVLQDNKRACEIKKLCEIFFENSKKTDNHFENIEERIAEMKDVQRLHDWLITIKFRQFGSTDYCRLNIYEKMVCVAHDFFLLTRGKWDNDVMLFVKSALDSLSVPPNEEIPYSDLIYELIIDKSLRDYLFGEKGNRICTGKYESHVMPHYAAMADCIFSAAGILSREEFDIDIWISNFMSDRAGNASFDSNTAFNIVCELLVIMTQFRTWAESEELLPAYRDIKKAALLGDVDAECKYAGLLIDYNYIDDAFNMTMRMESRVYNNPRFEELKDKVCEAAALR